MKSTKPSFTARLGSRLAYGACLTAILGPLLARFGVLPPLNGFLVFALTLPLALLALVFGFVGLLRTRRTSGRPGAGAAWTAVILGSLLLLGIGMAGRGGREAPPINDITTNLVDVPSFDHLDAVPENVDRDFTFLGGDAASVGLHEDAYGDLKTLHLQEAPHAAFERALEAAESLGWEIAAQTPPPSTDPVRDAASEEAEQPAPIEPVVGAFEATATSGIFRFVDDIVIRVQGPDGAEAEHSMVDIRSKSRDGRSDLGANAARIRSFVEAMTGG